MDRMGTLRKNSWNQDGAGLMTCNYSWKKPILRREKKPTHLAIQSCLISLYGLGDGVMVTTHWVRWRRRGVDNPARNLEQWEYDLPHWPQPLPVTVVCHRMPHRHGMEEDWKWTCGLLNWPSGQGGWDCGIVGSDCGSLLQRTFSVLHVSVPELQVAGQLPYGVCQQ